MLDLRRRPAEEVVKVTKEGLVVDVFEDECGLTQPIQVDVEPLALAADRAAQRRTRC